jgi:predicted nuclease of predicted toxin-antitoxin system
MKILLDENLPKKLKRDLSEHTVFTVRECGWNGKKNGELLALMQQELFDVLITFDKNLQHQQNFTKYTVSVIHADLPKGITIISDKTDIYGNTL